MVTVEGAVTAPRLSFIVRSLRTQNPKILRWDLSSSNTQDVTYDHRLKIIGHPVRSAIHKLVIQWLNTLNCANRHSVESKPLAALRVILG